MKDSLSGLASAGKGVMADSSAAGSVSGEQLVAMLGKSSGGASAAKEAMVATLGSGAALTIGFGAFAYYGYTTMDGMADAAAKRSGDLKALQNGGAPGGRSAGDAEGARRHDRALRASRSPRRSSSSRARSTASSASAS